MMNKHILFGFGVAALAISANTLAAPITDVQDYSNNTASEYFVDIDANKYNQPYYRNANQDWEWQHDAIAGSSFSSIELEVSAFDVDAAPCGLNNCEEDWISIWDGSSWVGFGNLAGANNVWAFTSFDLTAYSWAEAQVNAGLRVAIDIDVLDAGWLVTLGKATLSVDGGSQNCVPTPGVPCTPVSVPEPSSLALFGMALAALGFSRRRKVKA